MSDKLLKYTEITDELGAELRRIRNEQDLTLVQVAEALNAQDHQVSNVHLSRIETGQRRIDDELLSVLCDFYKVDICDVVIRASRAHIGRILASVVDYKITTPSLSFQIETAASEMNEAGQELAARLIRYLSEVDSLKK